MSLKDGQGKRKLPHNNELAAEVWSLFDPEEEGDGGFLGEVPHPRLSKTHKLDTSYLRSFAPEGTTTNQYTRRCTKEDKDLHILDQNMDIALRLFLGALRLFGDSIVEYDGKEDRAGDIRYYPPIIMTFWSGFEAFVRYTSELMTITVSGTPQPIVDYLKEQETAIDDNGQIRTNVRHYSVLNRYWLLLLYGYKFRVDKGSTYWQNLRKAQGLRDYYTHVAVRESRAIKTSELIQYLEDIMMAIIVPSCLLKRTLLLNIHNLYSTWAKLKDLCEEFTEQPFFHGKLSGEGYLFHCNFENVDSARFPNWREMHHKETRPVPEIEEASSE